MTSTSAQSSTSADRAIAATYRAEWGRLLSLLVARTRRLDLAEDALAEAFTRASERWRRDGVPANPGGWLYTTASRVVIGRLRAEAVAGRKSQLLAVRPGWVAPSDEAVDSLDDERLSLILLCCHPALDPAVQSPLALRLVVGTSTEQIARLFLVPTATMAARLTRAKRKIAAAGIPLSSPIEAELRTRLTGVCRTIYLAFTAGYTPGTGSDLLRADLAGEAVELAAVLYGLVPDSPQVRALLALLVIQHSRRDARVLEGRLVTLADQDRARWHDDEIEAGIALLDSVSPTHDFAEELRLQACIAAEHSRAANASDTDWTAIVAHYGTLEAMTRSPVVRLNLAVAIAEVDGPRAGVAALEGLDATLGQNHRLHAVRADLARRAGDIDLARASYVEALERCANQVERDHLAAQLDSLGGIAARPRGSDRPARA